MSFVYQLALGYVAATLLASGLGHALWPGGFRDSVRSHGVVPARLAGLVAALVTALELAAGAAAVAVLSSAGAAAWASVLFAACAATGVAFALYVRRLLARPEGIASCGCTPLGGPLTPASLVPACALALASLSGLAGASLGRAETLGAAYGSLGVSALLPVAWGATLAFVINMLPASAPGPAAGERW